MKNIFLFLCLIISIIGISACSTKEDPNVLKVSKSADELVGEDYETAISELKETGFTSIETKILDDLITGWLTKDGEIEEVEINGVTEFNANEKFQKDSKIVITYHTFPKKEKRDSKSEDKKSSKVVDQSTKDTTKKEKSETEDKKSSKTVDQSTKDSTDKSKQDVLTVQNNEELAALLLLKDEFHPSIGEFAKEYKGRTIEFDGNIADMMQHGKSKTRYDILIYAGDYSETTISGPSFKFKDVSVFDLNLVGSEIPENLSRGQNLHITAVVEDYNENSGLFFLKPISTMIR